MEIWLFNSQNKEVLPKIKEGKLKIMIDLKKRQVANLFLEHEVVHLEVRNREVKVMRLKIMKNVVKALAVK